MLSPEHPLGISLGILLDITCVLVLSLLGATPLLPDHLFLGTLTSFA